MGDDNRMPLLQVRVAQAMYDQLYKLIPLLQVHPNFRAGKVTLQDVVRLVISLGIEVVLRDFIEKS